MRGRLHPAWPVEGATQAPINRSMLRLFLKIIPIPLQLISLRLLVVRSINNNRQTKNILKHLEGKEISVRLTDIGRCYCLSVREGLLRINSHKIYPASKASVEGEAPSGFAGGGGDASPLERNKPDVSINGDTATFSGLFMGRLDPDSVFFNRTMKVDGDVGVLVLFKNLFESIR